MLDPDEVERALRQWGGFRVLHALTGGYRNAAFLVEHDDKQWVAKTSRRSEDALAWLTRVHDAAEAAGFVVPRLVSSPHWHLLENTFTLEPHLTGRPFTTPELSSLRPYLERFHDLTRGFPQRPGFASSLDLLVAERGGDVDLNLMPAELVHTCREAWKLFQHEAQSVIHGDLNPSNLLWTADGVALLDWDESRVDAPSFDLLALNNRDALSAAERRALDAWEVAVCWLIEPEHARTVAARLQDA